MHPLSQLVWSVNGHRLDDNTITTGGVPTTLRLASALLADHRIQYPWDLRLVRTMLRSEKFYSCRASHTSTESIPLRLNLKVNIEQKRSRLAFRSHTTQKSAQLSHLYRSFFLIPLFHTMRLLTIAIQLGRCTDEGCTILNTWVRPGPFF